MSVPERIKISREAGYHTDRIGSYGAHHQFMAFVTATLPTPLPKDWPQHKRWYAVLHTFDRAGNHIHTEAWFAGTTATGERAAIKAAEQRLDEMVARLGPVAYHDVTIRLFKITIDDTVFGLVDASEPDEGYESIHLLPNDLAFFKPWRGSYDT